jgi:hypothetical protein
MSNNFKDINLFPDTSNTTFATQIKDNTILNSRNGRIDILNSKSSPNWPLFQQEDSGTDNYNSEALKGIQTQSKLSCYYFSKNNIDRVQQQIRYNIWLQSNKKHIIDRQSDVELEIIMRSVYLQYSKNLDYQIEEQSNKLNSIVLNYCIPQILSEIEQYLAYKVNVSTLPKPMERPESLSSAGSKTLMLKNFF